jgi:hypothetical protein
MKLETSTDNTVESRKTELIGALFGLLRIRISQTFLY